MNDLAVENNKGVETLTIKAEDAVNADPLKFVTDIAKKSNELGIEGKTLIGFQMGMNPENGDQFVTLKWKKKSNLVGLDGKPL